MSVTGRRNVLVLLAALGLAPAGCATSVATLNGVVVDGALATAAGLDRVRVVRSDEPLPTSLGMLLQKGDTISTGPDARAVLVFHEEWEVSLDAGTTIYVSNPKAWLERGRLFVRQLVDRVRETFEVEDEHRVLAAEGTEFLLESDGTGGLSISVLEGSVGVRPKEADWEPVVYGPMERGHLQDDGPPQRMASFTPEEARVARAWVLELERVTTLQVPALVGVMQRQAIDNLESMGLHVGEVTTELTGSQEPGSVLRQSPPAGAMVRAGATVDLVVERVGVRVPSLTGNSRQVAQDRLAEAGLRPGRVTEVETDQYEPGTVIDQSRAVQSLVDTGTTVDLTVAIAVRAPVPSLVGMTLAAATRALAEAGLATGRVTEQTTFNTRAGTVLSQSVAARTRVTRGTVVDLTVATAPPFCTVPNLVNLTEAQAREALAAAGLREGQIQRLPYPPRNTVTSQGTQAGSRVDCGTAISFMTGTIGEPVRVDPEL